MPISRSALNSRTFSILAAITLIVPIVSCPTYAQVTCCVPIYRNGPMPPWFSGTNSQMGGGATTSSGWINHIRLTINGETGKDFTYSTPPPVPSTVGFAFDSTHWPNGTLLTVKIEAWDMQGHYGSAVGTTSPPAYNKGLSYGKNTLNYAIASAQNVQTQQVAIFPTSYRGTEDRKTTMLNDMPIFTHYYVDTHGAPGVFGDCFSLPNSDDATYYIHAGEINARVSAKGTSFPPYSFVHIDACESTGDDSLSTAFGIITSSVDRAFLGWYTGCYDSLQKTNWVKSVWQFLAAQETVLSAVQDATAQGNPGSQWTILGDPTSKVHGVYQGAVGQWFR